MDGWTRNGFIIEGRTEEYVLIRAVVGFITATVRSHKGGRREASNYHIHRGGGVTEEHIASWLRVAVEGRGW